MGKLALLPKSRCKKRHEQLEYGGAGVDVTVLHAMVIRNPRP